MNRLMCLIGIHRTVWVSTTRGTAWLQVRTCAHCGRQIGRQHRG